MQIQLIKARVLILGLFCCCCESFLIYFFNRHFDEKTNRWNWQCANIEVQKNVLRSIGAFLDSLSGDARAARHAIVKVHCLHFLTVVNRTI